MRFVRATLLACSTLLASTLRAQSAPDRQLIRDVRLFDGERVLLHRSVLISNGIIAQVDGATSAVPRAEVIDGRGLTLLPGLIDAHVHLTDRAEADARQALVFGVTTVLDMFSAGARLVNIKRLEAADQPDIASIRTAGIGATVPGGHPTQMGGPSFPTITSVDSAQAFVDARIAEGSDYIKIIHDDGSAWPWTSTRVPMLDVRVMKALIDAAHARGKLAVVHVASESQARDAISAGADGLAHLFIGDSVGAGFDELARDHHVFVVPTLSTLYPLCGRSLGLALLADSSFSSRIGAQWRTIMAMPKPDAKAHHLCVGTDRAVRQLVRAGVPLLTGTDAPGPGTTYGASVHGELELLVNDGLTPAQALIAATSAPARSFRLTDRGRIAPGMRADLLLVRGDPTTDIRATRDIVAVWKRGVRVTRSIPDSRATSTR